MGATHRETLCNGCGASNHRNHFPFCPVPNPHLIILGADYVYKGMIYTTIGYMSTLVQHEGEWQPMIQYRSKLDNGLRFARSIQEFYEKFKRL